MSRLYPADRFFISPFTGSDTLAETDLAGNQQEEYIFFNGQRIARRDVSSTGATIGLHYYFSDHLGSHAVVETLTTTGTTSCDQDIDYYPYGGVENDYCSGTSVPQHHKFTGKERDTESGLDNFEVRYDASSLGRFMSADPLGGHQQDPQTLNKYAYVRNSATTLTDPTGLDSYLACGDKQNCQARIVGLGNNGAEWANVQTEQVNGKTEAIQVGSDGNGGLMDVKTGQAYSGSANGSGMFFSSDGGKSSSMGIFNNGTAKNTFQDAGWANGNALSGFTFTLTNNKLEAGQTEAGFFTFA